MLSWQMLISVRLCILSGGESIGDAFLQEPGQFCQTLLQLSSRRVCKAF